MKKTPPLRGSPKIASRGGALPAAIRVGSEELPSARLRDRPEDFVVEEIPAYAPEGRGHHLFVTFRKTGMNTQHAVRQLAEALGCDGSTDVPACLRAASADEVTLALPNVPGREYVQPSEPIPVQMWDYASPDLITQTYDMGRRDGEVARLLVWRRDAPFVNAELLDDPIGAASGRTGANLFVRHHACRQVGAGPGDPGAPHRPP